MSPPQLQTLEGQPLTWPEAKARAGAWWARERRGVIHPPKSYPPNAVVWGLATKCAELLEIKASDVMARNRSHLPAVARAACYQRLREAGWTLKEIAAAFDRDLSTVWNQERQSQVRTRVDSEVAYLVSELRRFPVDPTPRRRWQESS